MTDTTPDSVDSQYLVLQVICAAFLVSLAVYVAVARLVGGQVGEVGPLPELLPWALVAVAAMMLLAAQPLATFMNKSAAAQISPEARQAGYRQAVIVAFAVREAAGILGLMLTLLTGEWMWVLALSALATLAMIIGWPRKADLERLANPGAPPPIG